MHGALTQAASPRRAKLRFNPYWMLVLPLLALFLFLYVGPIGNILWASVSDPSVSLENYRILVTSESIHAILWTTVRIGLLTTAVSVTLAYAVAYSMVHAGRTGRTVIFLFVLIPFWVSLLVRCFALLMLLRNNGIVNQVLVALGLTAEPLPLVDNELGVVIGMVHAMIPYAVLVLYSNMQGISKQLVPAARGLGAGGVQAFLRVYLPLSFPGVFAAALLVAILTLGFFVIPALLGGGRTVMIAEYVSVEAMQMARLGISAMMSTVLLVAVGLLLLTASRFLGLRSMFGAK